MSNKKSVETIVVSFEECSDPEFHPPSNFYYINALSDRVFIRVRNKKLAEDHIVSEYGFLKYKVVSEKQSKSDKLTVRGVMNNRSRSGTYLKDLKNRQGL